MDLLVFLLGEWLAYLAYTKVKQVSKVTLLKAVLPNHSLHRKMVTLILHIKVHFSITFTNVIHYYNTTIR